MDELETKESIFASVDKLENNLFYCDECESLYVFVKNESGLELQYYNLPDVFSGGEYYIDILKGD
jgi:hypothetical protein